MPAVEGAHRRFDPLLERWILVSAGRVARPWRGGVEVVPPELSAFDPECHLCPGNVRASGIGNPDYDGVYVFENDYPALRPGELDHSSLRAAPDLAADLAAAAGPAIPSFSPVRTEASVPLQARARDVDAGAAFGGAGTRAALLRSQPSTGTCRVICFDPRHDRTLANLPPARVRAVVDTWADQERDLARSWTWVQIFENRGSAMGASSPHPHGQIWASSFLPDLPATEDRTQRAYWRANGSSLLVDYAALESDFDAAGTEPSRVVVANDHWVIVVPHWALWPFETLVLPRRPVRLLHHLTDAERDSLAAALRVLLQTYDGLFDSPFPYSMGWHAAPGPHHDADPDDPDLAHWQLHAHFHPPLLRSPTVRKHVVGYDMFAGLQRDITPEDAAARLRAVRPRETRVSRSA